MNKHTVSSNGLNAGCNSCSLDGTCSNPSVLSSMRTALIQMAKSAIELQIKEKSLAIMPHSVMIDKQHHCRCFPQDGCYCSKWELDEGFIIERMQNDEHLDFQAVSDYVKCVIEQGPLGFHCVWHDGDKCQKSQILFHCPQCHKEMADYDLADCYQSNKQMMCPYCGLYGHYKIFEKVVDP